MLFFFLFCCQENSTVQFWQIYRPIIPRNGTICNFVVNSFSEGRDEAMQKITVTVKKTIAYLASLMGISAATAGNYLTGSQSNIHGLIFRVERVNSCADNSLLYCRHIFAGGQGEAILVQSLYGVVLWHIRTISHLFNISIVFYYICGNILSLTVSLLCTRC